MRRRRANAVRHRDDEIGPPLGEKAFPVVGLHLAKRIVEGRRTSEISGGRRGRFGKRLQGRVPTAVQRVHVATVAALQPARKCAAGGWRIVAPVGGCARQGAIGRRTGVLLTILAATDQVTDDGFLRRGRLDRPDERFQHLSRLRAVGLRKERHRMILVPFQRCFRICGFETQEVAQSHCRVAAVVADDGIRMLFGETSVGIYFEPKDQLRPRVDGQDRAKQAVHHRRFIVLAAPPEQRQMVLLVHVGSLIPNAAQFFHPHDQLLQLRFAENLCKRRSRPQKHPGIQCSGLPVHQQHRAARCVAADLGTGVLRMLRLHNGGAAICLDCLRRVL